MHKYKHIFFDLDHTLWDFDKNSEETFLDLYNIYYIEDITTGHLNPLNF